METPLSACRPAGVDNIDDLFCHQENIRAENRKY